MPPQAPSRRFYATATAVEAPGGVQEWGVRLDQFTLRTPAKLPLIVPTQALAEAIAREWAGQGDQIVPASMPITRLINVAIDRTPATRDGLVAEVVRYANGDLTCYRTPAPEQLTQRQATAWDPVLDWITQLLGIAPVITQGLQAIEQPPELLTRLEDITAQLDDIRLTVMASVTGLAGSAFLALGLIEGVWTADQVFAAIRIEEDFQAERWGADAEEQARGAARQADLVAAMAVIQALADEVLAG